MTLASRPELDRPRSVMVVEDDAVLRSVIVELLETDGYAVTWAEDGEEALLSFRADPADIVLTDIIMPRLDGLMLVQRIRDYDFETPILILTGYTTYDNSVRALRAGANDFIDKPFTNDVLLAAVRKALATRPIAAGSEVISRRTHVVLSLPVDGLHPEAEERAAQITEAVVHLDAFAVSAGFRRRRLALRRAVEEALLALWSCAGEDAALASRESKSRPPMGIRAEFDEAGCRIQVRSFVPELKFTADVFAGVAGDAMEMTEDQRHLFLVQSFSDEVQSIFDGMGIEMTFYRPRTYRPERQGA